MIPILRPVVCRFCGATSPPMAASSSAAPWPPRCRSTPARPASSTARKRPSPPSMRARSSRATWWSSATKAPRGGPGMREMLNPTSALAGMKLDKTVALITDGRFSGASAALPLATSARRLLPAAPLALLRKAIPSTSTSPTPASRWKFRMRCWPSARQSMSLPSPTSRPAG